jgi:hypothetical protein
MRQYRDRISELQDLTSLALRAVQTEMAALGSREADLRQYLNDLSVQKRRDPRAVDDPALIAGADLRWHYWVDQRRAAINAELAQVMAQSENCQTRMRAMFGRDQAVRALADRARKDDALRASRASAYES